MKIVRGVAFFVILMMFANFASAALISGMNHGAGLDTFLADQADPWKRVIDSDMMSGLILMLAWMIFRERGGRTLDTVAWVWLVLWWGNIIVAAYILLAAHQAEGDWTRFFLGGRAPGSAAGRTLHIPAAARVAAGLGAVVTAVYTAMASQAVGFALVPTIGYVAGLGPIALALAAIAMPHREAATA